MIADARLEDLVSYIFKLSLGVFCLSILVKETSHLIKLYHTLWWVPVKDLGLRSKLGLRFKVDFKGCGVYQETL